ncbi:MAG TPA: SAM-dependent methyltransferase [Peptococcaceae bacterium]|nr:SAM-dependent methyltransferase [Peptococcaceae bacterium]
MNEDNVFGLHSEQYDEWFTDNHHLFDAEAEAIRQVLPAAGQGIEIGTGTGLFASRLGIRNGVEPSAKMAAKAAARGIQMIDAYAENLPIGDNTYDYALMVTVDCFLQDVLKSFQEIRRILRAGGSFIIAFIDKATPLGRIYEAHKATSLFYRNARFHTSEEIGELLKTAGFKAEEARQTIFTLENHPQEIRDGTGEGVFAVIKAIRIE